MPIYMDVHIVPGVKAKDVAEAHRKDLLCQEEHDCKCMTYWIDEQRGSIFCLIEAPDKNAVEQMHSKAHGLIPHKIIEVNNSLVESFLGRIYDPTDAITTEDGLKVFADPSFRILLVTSGTDPVLLRHQLGSEKANELLSSQHNLARQKIKEYEGREAEHGGDGFIVSFASAAKAISCASAIQKNINDAAATNFRIGISAGEPVEKSNDLFGDTIQMAKYLCYIVKDSQVAVTSSVKELVTKSHLQNDSSSLFTLAPRDEAILEMLFSKLEENWPNADFDMEEYCSSTAMSKSQLYRKSISLTGLSPNLLLKDFRLEKARELMKKRKYSISQITYESGFTSPSYFTKCFKKKYGLLPMEYLELLH